MRSLYGTCPGWPATTATTTLAVYLQGTSLEGTHGNSYHIHTTLWTKLYVLDIFINKIDSWPPCTACTTPAPGQPQPQVGRPLPILAPWYIGAM